MGKRVVYVGGLSDTVSDHQLRNLFGTYGLVTRAHVVRHKHSGRSAGYGFVEMGSGEQALTAVVALEGSEWEGHCLRLYVTPCTSYSS
jgi:RNA recognition motif-containing protein